MVMTPDRAWHGAPAWCLLPLFAALAGAGCASGSSRTSADGFSLPDAAGPGPADGRFDDAPPEFDGYIDTDLGVPDAAPTADSRISFDDAGARDGRPSGDRGVVSCVDPYEPNQTCATAKELGAVKESGGWSAVYTGVASPASDADWFAAVGQEKQHFCLPLTAQCLLLQARLQVPAGRRLRLCVREKLCTASPTCADNAGTAGPVDLNVEYKVKATCGNKDDTRALLEVVVLDGKSDCAPYRVTFRYEGC